MLIKVNFAEVEKWNVFRLGIQSKFKRTVAASFGGSPASATMDGEAAVPPERKEIGYNFS